MRMFRAFTYASLLATMALVSACYDTTAPRVPASFDARQALATVDPLAAVREQGIFDSFHGGLSLFEAAIGSGTSPLGSGISLAGSRVALQRGLASAALVGTDEIPIAFRGKTLIYDPAVNAYVPDLAATGAPEAGVRLVLYAWGDIGLPSFPLARIGYADIAPVAAETPDLVEVVIVRDTPHTVISDFVVSHHSDAGGNSFGIEGSATDGTTTVSVTVEGTDSGPAGQRHIVYDSRLSVAALGISSREQLVLDQATASEGGTLELSYGGHMFTEESVGPGAELRFDGQRYASVVPASQGGAVQYLKPDGTSLTAQEVTDLNTLFERVILAHFFWIDLAVS